MTASLPVVQKWPTDRHLIRRKGIVTHQRRDGVGTHAKQSADFQPLRIPDRSHVLRLFKRLRKLENRAPVRGQLYLHKRRCLMGELVTLCGAITSPGEGDTRLSWRSRDGQRVVRAYRLPPWDDMAAMAERWKLQPLQLWDAVMIADAAVLRGECWPQIIDRVMTAWGWQSENL